MSSANNRDYYLRPRFVMPDLHRHGLSYDDFQAGLDKLSKPERGQFWQTLLRLGFEAASDQGVRGVTLLRLMDLMGEAFPEQVVNQALIERIDALSHSVVTGGPARVVPEVASTGAGPGEGGDPGGNHLSGDAQASSPTYVDQQGGAWSDGAGQNREMEPDTATSNPEVAGRGVTGDTQGGFSRDPGDSQDEGEGSREGPSPSPSPSSTSDKPKSQFAGLIVG